LPKIKDFVPLADLNDIVFGGWDVYSDNVFEAAQKAKVLEPMLLHAVRAELEAIQPMKAVFDRSLCVQPRRPAYKRRTHQSRAGQMPDGRHREL
jgi:hypothetical protein